MTTADLTEIIGISQSRILNIVRKGPVSRAEIARLTGLHPSTVTRTIATLLEIGILREEGYGETHVGRKPILLTLEPDSMHFIGLAVETTSITGIVANLDAQIVTKWSMVLTDTSKEGIVNSIEQVTDKLLAVAKEEQIRIFGIGIGIHGIVDSDAGLVIYPPAFGWRGLPLADILRARYKLPIFVENNANAMVLGEYWFSNDGHAENLFALKVGDAIGAGIVLKGELFTGEDWRAGEIGHLTVAFDGHRCNCGNYGCLETVASVRAMVRQARLMLKQGIQSELRRLVAGDIMKLTFADICSGATLGDALAIRVLEDAGHYLGQALASTICLLNPAKILLGGDILPVLSFILPAVREVVKAKALEGESISLVVEPLGLGADAVAIGAVTLVLKNIFEAKI